jgi:LemA protein
MIYVAILALAAFALVVVVVASIYNSLVTHRNRVRNAFSQIDVQLKRRYDLIPNLVEAVKGYMAHERQTLEAVIAARNVAATAANTAAADPINIAAIATLSSAESSLTAVLGRFRGLAEAYPDLKANQNTAILMEELSSTENRVAFARQGYNDSVMTYNTKRESFPANLIAGSFGFAPASLFVIEDDSQRANVQVKLS